MTPDYSPVFYWIRERENIRIRKERGDAMPWSSDTILNTYRFCNVRREDDLITRWIAANIRHKFLGYKHLWFMLCIARQINWPPTLAELIARNTWPTNDSFNPQSMTTVLRQRMACGEKVYTGAYMISAPKEKGADKAAYIAEQVCGDLWARRAEFQANEYGTTLEHVHRQLMQSNGWGNFMSYQAVVDMRFTFLLCDAPDVNTFAAAGPGTIRGLNRIHGRPYKQVLRQDQALDEMRQLFQHVGQTGVRMDFSDVPNILCETDKYMRTKLGQGSPRALYVPGRGS